MDEQGQSAMEYLLLIAGAILVVALVLVILNMLGVLGKSSTENAYTKVEDIWDDMRP